MRALTKCHRYSKLPPANSSAKIGIAGSMIFQPDSALEASGVPLPGCMWRMDGFQGIRYGFQGIRFSLSAGQPSGRTATIARKERKT